VIGRTVTAGIPFRPRAFNMASLTAFKSISPTSQAGPLANGLMIRTFRVAIWLHDRTRQNVGQAKCRTTTAFGLGVRRLRSIVERAR
jgi:hypothetical protein